MQKYNTKHLRTISLAALAVLLTACGTSTDGIERSVRKYHEQTQTMSLSQWESNTKSSVYWTSFIANSIPGLHLAGVWIDTFVVIGSAKSLALGNGAIIARQKNCPHLVSYADYPLIQGLWVRSIKRPELRSALTSARSAQVLSQHGGKVASQAAAKQLMKVLEKKIGLKVGGKIFIKYTIKVITKKMIGFAPILGGIAAALINKFMFMDPIDSASEFYYQTKAQFVCT